MYNFGKHRQSNIDPEVPGSLDSVLSSLETLLEHRNHVVPESVQEAMESFADSIGEQYDDPLVPEKDTGAGPGMSMEIPVLRDVIVPGDALPPRQAGTGADPNIDVMLDTLRSELEELVEEILDTARDRFSRELENSPGGTQQLSFADSINAIMQDALDRRSRNK